MKKRVSHCVSRAVFILILAGVCLGLSIPIRVADAAPSTSAASPDWLEQRQEASSFSSDWLNDLDNGEYAQAAAVFTVGGDTDALAEHLRTIRAEVGKLSSRSYRGATVTAVASDDSEHKIIVEYITEFSDKTCVESVEVLLWHSDPVILAYTLKKE